VKLPILKIAVSVLAFVVGVAMVGVWYVGRPLPAVEVYDPHGCPADSSIDLNPSTSSIPRDILAKFTEVPLEEISDADGVFRLLWFPTFDRPTSIRISLSGDRAAVTTRRLSGKGGYEWGGFNSESARSISINEWLHLEKTVDEGCFWYAAFGIREVPVTDGSLWIFEGRKDGRYNFVERTTPSPQMSEIFRTMLRISGEDHPDGYLPRE
jgi:hypothetical protein